VSLAGVPLLRRTPVGFSPRPDVEIASLLEAAYGEGSHALQSRLGVIAQALNSGDFATAMIAAVHTRTPELSPEAAIRLANAERELIKYNFNPDEPRDWHGRWTRDGSADPTSTTAHDQRPWPRVAEITFPNDASALSDAGRGAAAEATDSDDSPAPGTLQETFERKYDDLGPEDFSKRVTEFGYWLEAHGRQLSSAERERAFAEYSFLQNRLSLWLRYEYKSAREHGYLLSAALTLHQGANNSGLVPFGHLPESMLVVGGMIGLLEGASPSRPRPRPRPTTRPRVEELPAELLKPREHFEFGAIVERETAGIVWGKGIKEQGLGDGDTGWEKYVARQNPNATRLRPGSTGFDLFEETTGEAISAKTLDTKTMTYIRNPQEIYRRVTRYVDKAVNYEPRWVSDLDPAKIESRTIELAIPEYTSPEQWRYLLRAVIYGKENGVTVMITRIKQ
jgi:hypothetical protein